jgi:hypothetical protein
MTDQLNGMLSVLGLGGNASMPPSSGIDTGMTMTNPVWKLYADGDDSVWVPETR